MAIVGYFVMTLKHGPRIKNMSVSQCHYTYISYLIKRLYGNLI